ncbi:MAG: hypothetical protein M1820_004896 [Bogoriella megaspora]|nr:MAG: hypothetical protein M1820_004896 [Bogoriella megaspora]
MGFPEKDIEIVELDGAGRLCATYVQTEVGTGIEEGKRVDVLDSLQAFSSSIAGLLSSRAVLEGVGVGDSTATPTAALILSTTTDSVSRLCTILLAHRLGTALAPECKRYRLMADILNDFGMILDLLSPAIPLGLSWILGGRWTVLCAASCLRAGCGVLAGGAKASLSTKFARGADVGELNAKDASQETVISLLGTLTGTLVVRLITSPTATWIALLVLLAIHLTTNYLAVRAVTMSSLNRQRANIVFSEMLSSGRVLDPKEVAIREKVFEEDGVLRWIDGSRLGWAKVGVRLGKVLGRMGKTELKTGSVKLESEPGVIALEEFRAKWRSDGYALWWDDASSMAYITLMQGCSPRQQLRAWMLALVVAATAKGIRTERLRVETGIQTELQQVVMDDRMKVGVPQVADACKQVMVFWQKHERTLEEAGWDLDAAVLETRPGTRVSRQLLTTE